MPEWKPPPINKVFEALSAVADGRMSVDGDTGTCFSSSGNKRYSVTYDPAQNAIRSNDNGSYWQQYLGYPAIAFLLMRGVLEFRPELAKLITGIKWKDVNQSFKNDHARALESVLQTLPANDRAALTAYVHKLQQDIDKLHLERMPRSAPPPKGY